MHGIYTNMIYREIVYETINELQQLTSTKKTQKHKKIEIDKKKRQNKKKKRNTTNTVNFSTWSKLNIFPKTNKAFYTLCRSIRKYKKRSITIAFQCSRVQMKLLQYTDKTNTHTQTESNKSNLETLLGRSGPRSGVTRYRTHIYTMITTTTNKQTNLSM